ncbi:MAG TPA: PHP domain-containing protein [Dehalococcoidia bacterium]|nr:PHP domain-containing protein [Dehalococcoidia bacterium]
MIRADLHSHTYYSPDAVTAPEDYVAACRRRGINCAAVTDHNSIQGALVVQKLARLDTQPTRASGPSLTVIIGEEIRTREGEIIGFFLTEEIPGGLTPEETVERIAAQGGLVAIPHPFDQRGLRAQALARILPRVDIIEGFNARVLLGKQNERALAFAHEHDLPASAGSDAHSPKEVGAAYVEMAEFSGPREFLQALRRGRIVGRRSNPLVHLISTRAKVWRSLGWRPTG